VRVGVGTIYCGAREGSRTGARSNHSGFTHTKNAEKVGKSGEPQCPDPRVFSRVERPPPHRAPQPPAHNLGSTTPPPLLLLYVSLSDTPTAAPRQLGPPGASPSPTHAVTGTNKSV
jgi:hypothetical protein